MSDPAPHPEQSGPPVPHGTAAVPIPFRPQPPVPVPDASAAAPTPAVPLGGFDLSLGAETSAPWSRGLPVLGALAVIFGISALFKAPLILGPLAMAFGLAALFRRQGALGAIGGAAGLVGVLISPLFWALIGLTWVGTWLWSWLLG